MGRFPGLMLAGSVAVGRRAAATVVAGGFSFPRWRKATLPAPMIATSSNGSTIIASGRLTTTGRAVVPGSVG
ncbi:MAG: hypothetical protein U0841_05860 [Chloroflexia bacterium]